MDTKYKKLFKDTGLLTISNFASKILAFFLVPLYTAVLSTEEYGQFDLVSTTIQLVVPIFTLNTAEAVMRFCLEPESSRRSIVKIGFRIEFVGASVFAFVMLINMLVKAINIPYHLTLLIFMFYISYSLNDYSIQVAKGFDDVKSLAISGVIGTITMVTLNIVLLIMIPVGLTGFYVANIFGQLLPAVFIIFRTKSYNFKGVSFDSALCKKMVLYSMPLIMNYLAWKINAISDRYVVTIICGVAINGIYSISYKIPTLINTVQTIFTQAWQISVMREYKNKDADEYYQKTFVYINLSMGIICSTLLIMTKLIAKILYAKDFYQAWVFAPFLLISCVINTASGIIGPILLAEKRTKPVSTSAFVGAITNIILNIVLVYLIGAQGAAIATLLSSVVIFLLREHAMGSCLRKNTVLLTVIVSWTVLLLQAISMIYLTTNITYVVQSILIIAFIIVYKKYLKDAVMYVSKFLKK